MDIATKDETLKAALQNYHARMLRVLDHIDEHLEGNLNLDALSSIAAFSKFHFHRQFTATFGLSVHRYVQLARLKRASDWLVSGDARSVTKHVTSRTIANAGFPSFRKRQHMKWSWKFFCR
jgi:AraC family transcriptional regulator